MAAAGGGKDDRGEEPGDYRPRRFFEAEPGGKTNIQKVSFDKKKWDNDIVPKINKFYDIYMNEKNINNNPINLFMDDD